MKYPREKQESPQSRTGETLAAPDSLFSQSKMAETAAPLSLETLEQKMIDAARSEALSLAWLSGKPQKSFGSLLELKVRQAKQYVRRQRSIRGQSDRIIATTF